MRINMSKKKEKEDLQDSTMLEKIAEIHELVKIRTALSFGSKTGKRDTAESVMSRRINKRVLELSDQIVKIFGKDE